MYAVLLFSGSWALVWCLLPFSLCSVLVYECLVYSLRSVSLHEFLNFCVKYFTDRTKAQSWHAVLFWWLRHQRNSTMLESCNFLLLVNLVTPLKKNYKQKHFLLTWLFGFVVVESIVAIVKETYLSTIKLCKEHFKHQKSSSVSWSCSSAWSLIVGTCRLGCFLSCDVF